MTEKKMKRITEFLNFTFLNLLNSEEGFVKGLSSFSMACAELKRKSGHLVRLDFSSASNLGTYGNEVTESLRRKIYFVLEEKNMRISESKFGEAMELGEQENLLRAEFDKEVSKRVFANTNYFSNARN